MSGKPIKNTLLTRPQDSQEIELETSFPIPSDAICQCRNEKESPSNRSFGLAIPDEAADAEFTLAECEKMAWFFLGRLISLELVEFPDLNNSDSVNRLRFLLKELAYCAGQVYFS